MKNIILTITALVFISFINLLNAQAPNWVWAKSFGGSYEDQAASVVVDSFGNTIIVGLFNSSTITFGTTTLTNSGGSDIFIAKLDSLGNVLWAKSANGNDDDRAYSVKADHFGNLLVSGYYISPTISFDSITLNNVGMSDLFIVKYDYNGNVMWAKSAGGNNYDEATAVTIDTSGNIIATGSFHSPTITFDSITLYVNSNAHMFVVKYDQLGNVLWAKSSAGNGGCEPYSISTDDMGNIAVAGLIYTPFVSFDSIILYSNGSRDMFIVKYDALGNLLWAKSAGGTIDDRATSVVADAFGNLIVTGWFESTNITFGSLILGSIGWIQKLFVVKYDNLGNVVWAKTAGGINYYSQRGTTVTANAAGNIFVSGLYQGTITMGTYLLTSSIGDIYIVKYDNLGNVIWAKSTGGFGAWDEATCNTLDGTGRLVVTGFFNSSYIDFGTNIITNSGLFDIFIAKLDTTMTTGIVITENKNGISIYPNPASDQLTISSGQWAKRNAVNISISDITGKLIYTITATTPTTEINTKDFSKGVYLVKLQSKDLVETRKVIKN